MITEKELINLRLIILFLFMPVVFLGQNSGSFTYEQPIEESYKNPMNMSHGGFGVLFVTDENNVILSESLESFPAAAEVYYEYSRLLIPNSDKINVAGNIGAQLIFPLLGIRIPSSVDLRIGCLAKRESPIGSRGIIAGIGYEQVELIGGYSQGSIFTRAGLGFENVIAIYQYSLDSEFLKHNLTVGVKLNW